ncbi:hypothetical protein Hanom_Chr09g00765251 [Helianthus anomalus]
MTELGTEPKLPLLIRAMMGEWWENSERMVVGVRGLRVVVVPFWSSEWWSERLLDDIVTVVVVLRWCSGGERVGLYLYGSG